MKRPGKALCRSIALCAVLFASVAQAEDPPKTGKDWLFGDWGGRRTALQERGVTFDFNHVGEFATNVSGGELERSTYADQWLFGVDLDLDKLWGVHNAHFKVSITDRNGTSLSKEAGLDTLMQVQEIYGRGQAWRWTEFYYQQTYFDGTLDWKIGRLPVGDFASFSCDFMNLSFCAQTPGTISSGSYWYIWPVSQWATRLKYNFGKQGYVSAGAYQVNPAYLDKHQAFRLDSPHGTEGMLYILEGAWTPTFAAQGGLEGSYKLGAWYTNAENDDVLLDVNHEAQSVTGAPALQRSRGYGGYFNLQQTVYRPDPDDPDRGLDVFFNWTQADRSTAYFDRAIALGLFYEGAFASRPRDQIGFAIGSNRVNDRARTGIALANAAGLPEQPLPKTEYVAELFYGAQLTPFLMLRPNIQYIRHAGGVEEAKDILVFGLKTSLDF